METSCLYVIVVPNPRDPKVPDVIGPLTDEQTTAACAALRDAGIGTEELPVVCIQLTSLDEVLRERAWDMRSKT